MFSTLRVSGDDDNVLVDGVAIWWQWEKSHSAAHGVGLGNNWKVEFESGAGGELSDAGK